MLRTYLVLLLMGFFGTSLAKHQNATLCDDCQCIGGSTAFHVDCNDMHLTKIPKIPHDIRMPWILSFDSNSLTRITKFPQLVNLSILSFRYNKIASFSDQPPFELLTHLTELDLSYNSLSRDSLKADVFKGENATFHPLSKLDLSYNSIQSLLQDSFTYLSNLTDLKLRGNPIRDISVTTAQAISTLKHLKILDLSQTKIRRLPSHFFSELRVLQELNLAENDFEVIPQEVNYAHSLSLLYLDNNKLTTISSKDFWKGGLVSLQELHVSNMETLQSVEEYAFSCLSSIDTLIMKNNAKLHKIAEKAFTDEMNNTLLLNHIDISNNSLSVLNKNMLIWENISYIDLQRNPWNCDCRIKWIAKELIESMEKNNVRRIEELKCASPDLLKGHQMNEDKVQDWTFPCPDSLTSNVDIVIIIVLSTSVALLVMGSVVFACVIYRRSSSRGWIGKNVKYQKTLSDLDGAGPFTSSTLVINI